MTLTAQDIKLLASARMTDATDGGGPMTGVALQDAADNNVWPDISTIDRAQGALQLRRVYPAVFAAGTDALLGAHVILDDMPDDPDVHALLLASSASTQDVAGLATALNAAGEAYTVAGAATTTADTTTASVAVAAVRRPFLPKARLTSVVTGNFASGGALPTTQGMVPGDSSGGDVLAVLPQKRITVSVAAGQTTFVIPIPAGTAMGSERVEWRGLTAPFGGPGVPYITNRYVQWLPGGGVQSNSGGADLLLNTINRAAGEILLVFGTGYTPDTDLTVTYSKPALTFVIASGDVPSAFDSAGQLQVDVGSGFELAGAQFSANATLYVVVAGLVRAFSASGSVVGTFTTAGLLSVPSLASAAVSAWRGAKISTGYADNELRATLPVNIEPDTLEIAGETAAGASFTATADAAGVFATAHVTGTYAPSTGLLQLDFAANTKIKTLIYEGTQLQPQAAFAPLWGLDASLFAPDGTLPAYRPGQVAVLRHTVQVAAASYSNGNTVNLGRTNVADVRLVDANGAGIATGYTADLAAGTVSIVDVSTWLQPVRVRHAIEHVALVLSVPDEGTVVLNRVPDRTFPTGSVLSTALLLGDLQAQAGAAFAQETWTQVWSDTRIGNPITPQYNQATNPIVVNNLGAVSERWRFNFRGGGTTFDLIGEALGLVATGDINSPFAPINPATGTPYLQVAAAGWGGGWAAGHQLRLNTRGAVAGIWAARTVLPSASSSTPDSVTIAVRGDIDA
jgi:hypothetical protein